jgi:hypothetical protein
MALIARASVVLVMTVAAVLAAAANAQAPASSDGQSASPRLLLLTSPLFF